MSWKRREFLKQSSLATGALFTGALSPAMALPFAPAALTILHTNDVHSRIDPFPEDGSRNAGLGGVAARAALVAAVRSEGMPTLLLDAGDIFQGTPYFNQFKGEVEVKAMRAMGYDAATMGNHDFDAGIENFAHQWAHAQFPLVNCNYDFTHTAMETVAKPYVVLQKGPLKIGLLGLGIELDGLVPENLFGNTKYQDPILRANQTAALLKKEKCDFIICLSHLGDRYTEAKPSDEILARESYDIDLVIGGHTHRFFEAPKVYTNRRGGQVLVNQVGWGGIQLGRLDYIFSGPTGKNLAKAHTVEVRKKTST
ncbi:MAG: twin-arginine translocation signal domain-containing protein [Sphingobacteriia bacterium]|nr:MAG: twin-arginine translocation signal domain-containing protein [Sphingobacteriia bacterium]